ncbi:MAG: hypothetical protein II820_05575 [Ruminiclostridium sp.]|nr:hypothetical protein [Ruminiclostridium sp.]
MTVEELNIKISADAGSFKQGLSDAEVSLEKFRQSAVKAGEEVTKAFGELISVGVTSAYNGESTGNSAVSTEGALQNTAPAVTATFSDWRSGGVVSVGNAGISVISPSYTAASSRTADVMTLEKNETVIGAVGGNGDSDTRPVNITTTVELDGDKIGESVNRFNMRRNRITNGIYG